MCRLAGGLYSNEKRQNNWFNKNIEDQKFSAIDYDKFKLFSNFDSKKMIQNMLGERLKIEMDKYEKFIRGKELRKDQMRRQRKFQKTADIIWGAFNNHDEWFELNSIIEEHNLQKEHALRVVRLWSISGIIKVVDRTHPDGLENRIQYDLKKKFSILPKMIYVLNHDELLLFKNEYEKNIVKNY